MNAWIPIFTVVFVTASGPAGAQDGYAGRAVAAASNFHGDLTSEGRRPTYMFGARYTRASLGLGFDVLNLSVHQNDRDFPYDPGDQLDVLAFLLLPHACHQLGETVGVCGGIGLGTVNVNSAHDRQDYGTWHYEAATRTGLGADWSLELVGKYVGKIEQKVRDQSSAFWFVAYGAGLARAF